MRGRLQNTKIEVYTINTDANRSPLQFPRRLDPLHMRLFPEDKSMDSIPMFEALTLDNAMRFVKENCANPRAISVKARTEEEIKAAKQILKHLSVFLTDQDEKVLRKRYPDLMPK